MELKSDATSKSTFSFSKLFYSVLDSTWFYAIVMIGLVLLGWAMNENYLHIIGVFITIVGLLLISSGEVFKDWRDFYIVTMWLLIFAVPISYMNTPTVSKSDSMDITHLVKAINVDEECGCGTRVLVDFDKPFEDSVELKLEDRHIPIITDNERVKDFIFTANKVCEKFPSGTIDCKTTVHLTNKFEENEISNTELKNSIYPKKFDMDE
jgi:hypothetical protein